MKYVFIEEKTDGLVDGLVDTAVIAFYEDCKWQEPQGQKIGCYQKPIIEESGESNGGISNNLSTVSKSCQCTGSSNVSFYI